jgi:L-aspartate semialdehyde sulfurtransferase ferredoxin
MEEEARGGVYLNDWMHVEVERCMHCGACAGTCPENAIYLREVMPVFNDSCVRCGRCVKLCPVGAITMEAKKK